MLIMVGCAHGLIMSEIAPGDGVTAEFQPSLDKFNGLAEQYLDGYCQPPIDVGYGNLKNLDSKQGQDTSVIGVCIPTARPMVLFDRSYWTHASPTEREMVAFHEFGHCILDLDHDDRPLSEHSKQKLSLMAPVVFSEYEYAQMYDYYIRGLFAATEKTAEDWKEGCSGEDQR